MICVDASVAVKWVIDESLTPRALAVYATAVRDHNPVVAPSLLLMEVNNALLRRTRASSPLTEFEVAQLLTDLLSMDITFYEPSTLHQTALSLAIAYGLPAVYDAYYLALSVELSCPFWTDDQRLLRTLNGRLPFVHWIGDFAA